MPGAQKDLIIGLDISALASVTKLQLMAMVSGAAPYPNIGLVFYGSETPDVANNPRFKRYPWIDTSTNPPGFKIYNPNTLVWENASVGQITQTGQIDDGIITIAKLAVGGGAPNNLIRCKADLSEFEFCSFADFLNNGVIPLTALNQGGASLNQILAWNGSQFTPVAPPSTSSVPITGVTGIVGAIFPYAGSVVPAGFLLCDGTSYSTAAPYDQLFAAIGYAWGGSGANFKVPDLRGRGLMGAGIGTSTWTFETTDVNTGSDEITLNATNNPRGVGEILTGTALTLAGGSLPGGLVAGTYYAIKTGALTYQLATSLANALAGIAVNITTVGAGSPVGTFTLTLTSRTLGQNIGEEGHALKISEIPAHTHVITPAIVESTGGAIIAQGAGPDASNQATSAASTGGSGAHNNIAPSGVINWIIKYT